MSDTQGRKLIAVDCDGTLFDRNGYPSQRTCDVVKRVVEAGHLIVAVTGRSRLTACDRLEAVEGMRYLVCSNGAYTWDSHNGELVWETPMPQSLVTDVASRLRNVIQDLAFGWETRTGIGFEDRFVELAGGVSELESGGKAGDPWTQPLYKLKVRHADVSLDELQRKVAGLLGNELCEITTSGAPFIEITAKGSHKASGLEKAAVMLGFVATDTIAFGDNHNDLPMLEWAGHAVAMGNALEIVKEKAHAVTLHNTQHGVAHYLEGLFDSGTL